jgi:hypothetical protein
MTIVQPPISALADDRSIHLACTTKQLASTTKDSHDIAPTIDQDGGTITVLIFLAMQ